MHDLDENPHALRRGGKQAAKEQSKGEPKKIPCILHGICTVTRLRIGIWRGMVRSTSSRRKWEDTSRSGLGTASPGIPC